MVRDPADLRRYRELDGKTFLVCVGAMKAATSWLYHYLAALPDVTVSPLKELHFFNARYSAYTLGDMQALAIKRLRYHLDREGDPVEILQGSEAFQASVDGVQMIYDDNAYFGHFARICGPDTRVLCDITPAYAVIGPDGFEYMRDVFATQDIRLRLVFLMRDPIDRLWSQLRYLQEVNPAGEIATRWSEAIESPRLVARADYEGTINDLDGTFPEEDILYLFYEDLFRDATLRELCRFVGVDYRPGETGEARNRTLLDLEMPDAARAAFRNLLAGQYAFCRARFGDRIPESWHK